MKWTIKPELPASLLERGIASVEETLEKTFKEFSQLEYINEGAQKRVYSVIYNGEKYALKLFRIGQKPTTAGRNRPPGEASKIERLIRELSIQKDVACPAIVQLADYPIKIVTHERTDYCCYLEEFIDGDTLEDLIETGDKPTLEDLKRLTISACEAIKYIWGKKVIHRDIRPANIIRTRIPNRPFVILDFGIALGLLNDSITDHGRMIGTYRYSAPEQHVTAQKEFLDYRVDLYSLGVTVYEYAVGTHPYIRDESDPAHALDQLRNNAAKPIHSIRTDLPSEFSKIVGTLIRKQPHLRPNDMGLLITALSEV
ncbi:MAG: serine/threonine-protein kinase [Candidatus Zixiibacteriota bacterium]|jgi:serine/threonine protein kinase